MPQISVVIITFNEEKNIERCILSVQDLADDIVVVDSFSTDRTEEICKSHGVRFIQNHFNGHIEQKNFAISKAHFPYILSLDADEQLSEELKKSIQQVKNNWDADGYYFNRLTNYCGQWIRHSSWYPASKLRLWDSRKGKWGGLNPHDIFILQKGCSQKFLKGDLYHYSYYAVSEHIIQINRFSDILAKSYFEAGRKAGFFDILFHPAWRFFRDYIIKLGFLDGFFGMVICRNSSFETYLKYVKLRRMIKEKNSAECRTICFFNSTSSWGGGEKWHYDISTRLSYKGNEVIVITNEKSGLYNRVFQTRLKLYSIRITNSSFLNPFKIFELANILRKEKVKSIIVNLPADLKVGGIAAKIAGVKEIIYRRGSAIPIRNSLLNRLIFRKIVTKIIANSEETKRTILTNNHDLIDPSKITVIYNGINLNEYDEAKTSLLHTHKNGELIIGNAGRLVKQKGQMYLIDLAFQLKSKGFDFKILIAGEGKLQADLLSYAETRGVKNELVFLGFVENIKSFMLSIDIFCLPSLWEGFGYVLVEAMACRKPVIAFDSSSNPEIVSQGETGYLIPNGNMEIFSEKLELLIRDKALRERFGNNGRARVEAIFDLDQTIHKVELLLGCSAKV
jgi:glycosyltransferase involved in cell wall biosynthesis